jgi:hypothetical protein
VLSIIRLIALFAALVTLTLMVSMARPWGDNHAYQSLSGYAGLVAFAVWATLSYLMIIFLTGKAVASYANNFVVIIAALIISLGGVALYVDAAWLNQAPQGALVFIVVPFYQLITLGLLAGFLFLFRKRQFS